MPADNEDVDKDKKPEGKQEEERIPLSRLNEVIKQRDDANRLAEKLQKEKDEANQKTLQEQGKWKEIADAKDVELNELRANSDKLKKAEETLTATLGAELKAIPETLHGLIPDGDAQTKLAYIAKNREILTKPTAFDIGAGKGNGGQNNGKLPVQLNDEQKRLASKAGMTEAEYAASM